MGLRETTRADLPFVMATEAAAKRGGFVGGDIEETHRRYLSDPDARHWTVQGEDGRGSVTPSCAGSRTPTTA